jgi:FKBP-type peptidyl-prolyl cis-trans isomerase
LEEFIMAQSTSKRLPLIIGVVFLLGAVCGVGIYMWCHRKPSSLKEKVSYTVGSQFGKSLTSQNLDLDSRMVSRGIVDSIDGGKNPLTDAEMEAAMVQLNENRRKEMAETAAKNKIEADNFLSRNRVAEGVKVTASGLQYKIIAEGKGPQPKDEDIVAINFRGTFPDGKEFDQSYKRGVPAEFPVKGVIPGWGEGLKLMHKGGKAMIYVPPELGYGDRARQNIPSNAVLIFEVELVDVKPAPPPAAGKPPGPPAATHKKK